MTDGAACEIADAIRAVATAINGLSATLATEKVGEALDGLADLAFISGPLGRIAEAIQDKE